MFFWTKVAVLQSRRATTAHRCRARHVSRAVLRVICVLAFFFFIYVCHVPMDVETRVYMLCACMRYMLSVSA